MVKVKNVKTGFAMIEMAENALLKQGDTDGVEIYSAVLGWYISRGSNLEEPPYKLISNDQAIALGVMIMDICTDCEELVSFSPFDCADALLTDHHHIDFNALLAYGGANRAEFAKVIGWLVSEDRICVSGGKNPQRAVLHAYLEEHGLLETEKPQLPKG